MEIKGESLKISTATHDDQGNPLEPEQRAVEQVIETSIPLTMSNGQSVEKFTDGKAPGNFNAGISTTTTAAEIASGFKGKCRYCKNFDNPQFRRWMQDVKNSRDPERNKVLNGLRAKLLGDGYAQAIKKHEGQDADLDVEHAMHEWGFCPAMSEALKDMVIVWPDAGCPTTDAKGAPLEILFRPRDRAAEQAGNAGYDAILKAAQGAGPKRKPSATILFGKK